MPDRAEEGVSDDDLLKICELLNAAGVRYLIAGGFAVMLHEVPRFTADIDLLIEESEENYRLVIIALSQLADGAAKELVPSDFEENLVVKIADEIQVDVSRRAWVVTYADAIKNAKVEVIEGVQVPYLGLEDLIRSKRTYREKDRLDIQMLLAKAGRTGEDRNTSAPATSGCLKWIGLGIFSLIFSYWL